MTKKRKMTLLSSLGVASVVGTTVGISSATNQHQTSYDGNKDNIENNETKPSSNNNQNTNLESNNKEVNNADGENAYGFSLRKKTRFGSNNYSLDTEYILSIQQNEKKEGKIFLANENGKIIENKTVRPGDTFYITYEFNKGYEGYEIRDLLVYGKNPNYKVPAKKVQNKRNLFSITLPTIKESTLIDGSNWMYGENVQISIIPSFIIGSIGVGSGEVNWEHGTYFEVINGYVYQLNRDAKWSELKNDLYQTFDNSSDQDKQNPVHLFFYLNGYTLTFDENVTDPNFFPSGWDIHFLNNKNDIATEDGKFGKITTTKSEGFNLTVKGAISFGWAVEFNYIPYGDGVKILQPGNNNGWNTTISNYPQHKNKNYIK